ncbi:MAG: hypothetical protein OXI88_12180 [Gammaproteobacteria bacterium]|nr:hypothetical protein [Gammaproteobacteria bacterium]
MNYDTIAVILAVVAGWYATHRDIVQLRDRISNLETELKERMARLEGLFEGFTSNVVNNRR